MLSKEPLTSDLRDALFSGRRKKFHRQKALAALAPSAVC